MAVPSFPDDFLWGVSTSAFQIEGAAGRGPSVWDAFCERAGAIRDGSDASVAAGHVSRYREDVALLKGLGVGAYRFSVSWPRVLAPGGLDFYDRLVDELLAAGIRPVPTLYHWDTPLAIGEAGGWLLRDTAFQLADYAGQVARRLADRVPMWITINEPAEVTLLGHALGTHAPGQELLFDALPVAHNLLLGHGLAVQALRAAGAGNVGVAMSHTPVWTAGSTEDDAAAASLYDTLMNWLFADPILTGRYPEGFELGTDDDLAIISQPLDWYGINYYNPTLVGAPDTAALESFGGVDLPSGLPFGIREIEGYPLTDFGWPVVPDGLRQILLTLRDRFGERLPPVYVTENGCSAGELDDRRRVDFMDGHLRALHQALDEGVDVRGYFVWSLMDNFEWAEGYSQRFGLVHVDFETLRRTPRESYRWLAETISPRRPGRTTAG